VISVKMRINSNNGGHDGTQSCNVVYCHVQGGGMKKNDRGLATRSPEFNDGIAFAIALSWLLLSGIVIVMGVMSLFKVIVGWVA